MESTLDATWTAEEVIRTYPQAISVFIDLKMDCVGCHLDKFCTLADVAAAYELPLELLLQKLRESCKASL
jgi:hybrid cluster-associated redox disulfide protein